MGPESFDPFDSALRSGLRVDREREAVEGSTHSQKALVRSGRFGTTGVWAILDALVIPDGGILNPPDRPLRDHKRSGRAPHSHSKGLVPFSTV
jgi:hypothetical protein